MEVPPLHRRMRVRRENIRPAYVPFVRFNQQQERVFGSLHQMWLRLTVGVQIPVILEQGQLSKIVTATGIKNSWNYAPGVEHIGKHSDFPLMKPAV